MKKQSRTASNHLNPLDGAHLDFNNDMSYGDYLALDDILEAQHPLSEDHNELLFIIQHQTSELWMKLMLHELSAAREQIKRDDLPPAFKMMARVSRIMEQLVHAWDVLATLTPSDSGSVQHMAGMQSSDFIIAINKDPNADIFQIANLGIVGDLNEIVPALTKAFRERSGK